MTKSIVLNPLSLDRDSHSDSHAIKFTDKSLTVQADRESADINNIVKKFGVTGMLPYGKLQAVYDDFTEAPTDYHEALTFIREADAAFYEFPANVRYEFDNDAGKFLQALEDPVQRSRFEALGLVPPVDQKAQPSAADTAATDAAKPPAQSST